MKNGEYFKQKESRIKKAIERVEKELSKFNSGIRKDVDNWNKFHDLEDRLNNRLWDNWSDFKEWHWETYKFNTY